jgi:hypothetical protein
MLVAQVLGGVNSGLVSTGSVDGGLRITVVELKVHVYSQLMSAFLSLPVVLTLLPPIHRSQWVSFGLLQGSQMSA